MSESEKDPRKKTEVYQMKRIPLNVDINGTGEFRCVPDSSACEDSDSARAMLDVFREMDEERRGVWASRLDREETFKRCPVIKKDPELSKEFDELCAAYGKSKRATRQMDQQHEGGERDQ